MARKYNIEMQVDSKGVVTGVAAGERAVDGFSKKAAVAETRTKALGASVRSLGAAFGVTLGAVAIGQAFRAMIREAQEAREAYGQLRVVVASTGGAAGFTADELVKMSKAMQELSTRTDVEIQFAQGLLATFTQIGREVFPEATRAVLDISAKMKNDLKGAAIQVGKALNDPIRGVSALAEVGVSFTQSQREMIRAMVEAGDVAGAQKVILAELAVEFKGADQAAMEAAGTGFKQFRDMIRDIAQGIGEPFLIGLNVAALAIVRFMRLLGAAALVGKGLAPPEVLEDAWKSFAATVEDATRQTAEALAGAAAAHKDSGAAAAANAQRLETLKSRSAGAADEIDRLKKSLDAKAEAHRRNMDAIRAEFEELRRYREIMEDVAEAVAGERSPLIPTPDQVRGFGELMVGTLDDYTAELAEIQARQMRERLEQMWAEFVFWAAAAFAQALGQALDILLGNAEGSFKDVFRQFGRQVGGEIGFGIGQMLGGEIGGMIGRQIGQAIGEWAARTIIKLLGGNQNPITGQLTVGAGGGTVIGTSNVGSLEEAYRFLNEVIRQIEAMTRGTIDLLGQIQITVNKAGEIFVSIFDEFGNLIQQAQFDNMGEAVEFALIEGIKRADLSGMSQAFAELIQQATSFDQLMADLKFVANLPRTLQQMGGAAQRASAQILETRRAFNDMRNQIADLGLSAEAAAPLLELVARAERNRMKELRLDVLGQLADWAERLGVNAKFVLKIREAQLKVEFAIMKAQLIALGIWEEYAKLFAKLEGLALDALREVEELGPAIVGAVSGAVDVIRRGPIGVDRWRSLLDRMDQLRRTSAGGVNPIEQAAEDLLSIFREIQTFNPKRRAAGMREFWQLSREVFERVSEDAKRSLREFRASLMVSDVAPGFITDRVRFAEKQFRDTLAAALGGDFDAFQRLQGLADTLLSLGSQAFGTATSEFARLRELVFSGIDQALEVDLVGPAQDQLAATIAQTDVIADQGSLTRAEIRDETRRQTRQLVAALGGGGRRQVA